MEHHTLCILPWLRLKRDVRLGDFHFLRWPRDSHGIVPKLKPSVDIIAGIYRTVLREPRECVTIVVEDVPSALPPLDDRTERYAHAANLLGMALIAENQYYAQTGRYCNSTDLEIVFHNFRPGSEHVAIEIRRRDGRAIHGGLRYETLQVTEPQQCMANTPPEPSRDFLDALGLVLREIDATDRVILQTASLFMQANTDSASVVRENEVVMMASALERLLGEPGKAKGVSGELGKLLEPFGKVTASGSKRLKARGVEHAPPEAFLHQEWARELYVLRGMYSHGNDIKRRRWRWERDEHLVAAAFLIPLVVKLRLAKAGKYALTHDDEGSLHTIDKVLDVQNWHEHDQEPDGRWHRTLEEGKSEHKLRKACDRACARVNQRTRQGATEDE